MATCRRKESRTGFYHIVVKGINNEKIFNQQREKAYFKEIILKYFKKYPVEMYAYCIMSNHAHFIIRAEIQELSSFMARILAEYALYYNYKHYRNGHVFQNRFRSECIETESYFWNCLRYIHLNPQKAGMVNAPIKYKFSSMQEYHKEKPELLHQEAFAIYKQKFSKYAYFEEFHLKYQYEVFGDIREEITMQWLEIANILAQEIFEENGLKIINQVFEEKSIREEYIRRIRQRLKVSRRKSKEIYVIIKNKVENQ